jgi:hypothetical protein
MLDPIEMLFTWYKVPGKQHAGIAMIGFMQDRVMQD